MKKIGMLGLVALMILLATGYSFAELTEYGIVARNAIRNAIAGKISTDVELERMQVLLDKIDAKAKDQKRLVAKSRIELEDAEFSLAQTAAKCDRLKRQMIAMRNPPIQSFVSTSSSSCGSSHVTTTKPSTDQLAFLLSSYKTHKATLSARQKTVAAHRAAFEKLNASLSDWLQQRETLRQQVASLKVRHSANQITTANDLNSDLNNEDLSRAIELRKKLENRIRVEEELNNLSFTSIDLTDDVPSNEDFLAEVDAILADQI